MRIESVGASGMEGYHKITVVVDGRAYTNPWVASGESAMFTGVSINPGDEITVSVEWILEPPPTLKAAEDAQRE